MVVPSLNEGLHQKLGRSTKQKRDGVRPSETCKEKYCVRHIFTRIPHDTCPFSRSTQEQEHLDRHECRGHVERLEHKTSHAFSVVLRIHGSFRKQDGGMFLKQNPEYVVEKSGSGLGPNYRGRVRLCEDPKPLVVAHSICTWWSGPEEPNATLPVRTGSL